MKFVNLSRVTNLSHCHICLTCNTCVTCVTSAHMTVNDALRAFPLVSFWLKVDPVHHNLPLTVSREYCAEVIVEFGKKLD